MKQGRDNGARCELETCASGGLSDTWLSVTIILLTQRELRVVGAIRQDEDIDAVRVAVGVGVWSVVADVGVGGVGGQVAGLGIVVQAICNVDGCLGGGAAGAEED